MKNLITLLSATFFFFSYTFSQDNSADALINEGVELHDDGKYEDAIKKYEEALKIEPRYLSARHEAYIRSSKCNSGS